MSPPGNKGRARVPGAICRRAIQRVPGMHHCSCAPSPSRASVPRSPRRDHYARRGRRRRPDSAARNKARLDSNRQIVPLRIFPLPGPPGLVAVWRLISCEWRIRTRAADTHSVCGCAESQPMLDRVEVRDRGVYFITSLIRLVCALKRTAASVRLKVRPMALTVLRPASVRRVLTSARVQGRRLSMGSLMGCSEDEF
jgi:hypothetical protein